MKIASKILLVTLILLSVSSCFINYKPCRGQDYLLAHVTHQEFIAKLDSFRINFPEYVSGKDRVEGHVPWYYFEIEFEDLNVIIKCEMHMGDAIPNPPTHIQLSTVRGSDNYDYQLINSDEIEDDLNERIKSKFELEILNRLNLNWERDPCW